jgi:CRP/FNR family transcriptional activator FtrB
MSATQRPCDPRAPHETAAQGKARHQGPLPEAILRELVILQGLPLLRDLREDTRLRLLQCAGIERLAPQSTLGLTGVGAGSLAQPAGAQLGPAILLEGMIELFARDRDRETTVVVARRGDGIGLERILGIGPAAIGARALNAARILTFDIDCTRELVREDGQLAAALACELSRTFGATVEELVNQRLRSSLERLAHWLLATHDEQGGHGRVHLPFDKRTLAARLGMTPENLSRTFAALASHDVIVRGRDISIGDPARLAGLAAGESAPRMPDLARRAPGSVSFQTRY